MQGRCDKHLFEAAEDRCGRCGYEFCGECLVYSFGAKRPPFCIPCAVAAAGIRSTAGGPAASGREMKALRRERRRQRRATGLVPPEALETAPAPDGEHAVPSPVLPSTY
jgi:hypothetical protein